VAVPYHLDERLAAIGLGVPLDRDVTVKVPAADAWHRMSALYEHVARVEPSNRNRAQVVVSADCTAGSREFIRDLQGGVLRPWHWLRCREDSLQLLWVLEMYSGSEPVND